MDFTELFAAIDRTRKAIADGDRGLAETEGWEMCKIFERDFQVGSEKDYTPELCRIQLEALGTLLDLHIMRGDPIDISWRFGQFAQRYHMDKAHFPEWTSDDWKPIEEVVIRELEAVRDFYTRETRIAHQPRATEPGQCKCLLCQKNMADRKGSHMVPHLLIAKTFSYDGSTERDKVVVEVDNLSEGYRETYFGHQVYDDTINELIGRSFTDEEIEEEHKKVNALTRDYVFCDNCEKRFSTIESYYADILERRLKNSSPKIPYLFWISVMWRMSVGEMGTKLMPKHEEKLRKVLDKCLALRREDIVLKKVRLGYCAYSLYRANDTKDETLGIMGPHTPTKPYMALIGNLLIRFYTSISAARSFCRRNKLSFEELNDGNAPEKIGELTFIEFWQVKRRILDLIWNHDRSVWNLGKQQNQTLSKFENFNESFKEWDMENINPLKGDIPAWFNAENSNVTVMPRAIRKIADWIKKHPDEMNMDNLSTETDYTKEELYVMLGYFEKMMKKQAIKKERDRMKGALLNEVLMMDRSVFHD